MLKRFGKHDQSYLYWGWLRRLPGFNPANAPGFSPHECRSDGVFPPGYRRGSKIPPMLVGQDWSNGHHIVQVYRSMGVPAVMPYNSPFERQHVDIARIVKGKFDLVLHPGDHDKAVHKLKTQLAFCVRPHTNGRVRYFTLANRAPGYGPDLEKAVKQFQHDHGLTPDGIVGEQTWAQLRYSVAYWKKHRKAAQAKPKPKPASKPITAPHPAITLNGPDVSSFQGDVNWKEVVKHCRFAFVKATEGLDYTDKTFTKDRVHAMRGAGIIPGFYHFARPQPGRKAEDEAKHFIRTVKAAGGLRKGDLPPVLDIEWVQSLSQRQLRQWVLSFCRTCERLTGVKPIIYTGLWFWGPRVGNPRTTFGGYPLWLAAYVTSPVTFLPKAWKRWTFWQFTDKGRVPGISTPCDVSHFHGSLDDLKALTIH